MKKVINTWVEERDDSVKVCPWGQSVNMEESLVQILVVVVITKLRTFWTEVEKGSGWRAFRSGWVDPKRFVQYDKKWDLFWNNSKSSNRKGIRLKFLNEERGEGSNLFSLFLGYINGNVTERRDGRVRKEQRYLLCIKVGKEKREKIFLFTTKKNSWQQMN